MRTEKNKSPANRDEREVDEAAGCIAIAVVRVFLPPFSRENGVIAGSPPRRSPRRRTEMLLASEEEKRVLRFAATSMSLGHGIARVLLTANDIISGTAPASGVPPIDLVLERAIANVIVARVRLHVCACVYVLVRVCTRVAIDPRAAFSPSF